jgi:hypothetical protein
MSVPIRFSAPLLLKSLGDEGMPNPDVGVGIRTEA